MSLLGYGLSIPTHPLPFTTIEVEALATRRALELAMETSFDQVILEGDS